jgi:hypothetical protein
MARPSTPPPSWATNAGTRDPSGAITSGRQGTGWVPGESIAARAFNAVLGQFADWIVYAATLLPADGIVGAVAFRVYDAIGGNLVGTVSHSAGDLTVTAEAGLVLIADGAGTPGIYLDDAAGTVRLQSYAADAAVIIRSGWNLNDQDFRVGFGDIVGDGTGYPTYSWDLSPSMGGWMAFDSVATAGVVLYVPHAGGSGDDTANLVNHTGGISHMYARCPLRRSVAISEDGATSRETVKLLTVIFAAEVAATQPTVILYEEIKDGSAVKTAIATCTCPASATRQTVTSGVLTADLDWATYRYFLEWDALAGVVDGAGARGVEQVIVDILTRAGA